MVYRLFNLNQLCIIHKSLKVSMIYTCCILD